jgi:8-oxo-dGTP diphosphatase
VTAAQVAAFDSALPELHVVAGVLRDARGRLLLAQRSPGREDGGRWEFPGGKREPGESNAAALRRELAEELGIDAQRTRPLLSLPQAQPHRRLWLHALEVEHWSGELRALEAQRLRWQAPQVINAAGLVPADRPILSALREPAEYWITPPSLDDAEALHALLLRAETGGAQRLLLRLPELPMARLRPLAERAAQRCKSSGIELLLGARERGVLELAVELDCGAQLAQALLERLDARPAALGRMAASCHDAASLRRAEAIGCDFATLSPVQATTTHPQAQPLGWTRFAELRAVTTLPVYALGGVGPGDLATARATGAQGVAGIGAFFGTA